jgi:hypothetical protein
MRCRRREGPWGSHHDEASALKWLISFASMVEAGGGGGGAGMLLDLVVVDEEKDRSCHS